jgi:hypothetical protein
MAGRHAMHGMLRVLYCLLLVPYALRLVMN